MRVSLRMRFALLAGSLVLAVAAIVALDGYLTMRDSLLSRAELEARDQAGRLAGLVDNPATNGERAGAGSNQVDINDPALTGGLAAPELVIEVSRPNGKLIQASDQRRHAR